MDRINAAERRPKHPGNSITLVGLHKIFREGMVNSPPIDHMQGMGKVGFILTQLFGSHDANDKTFSRFPPDMSECRNIRFKPTNLLKRGPENSIKGVIFQTFNGEIFSKINGLFKINVGHDPIPNAHCQP